MTQQQPEKTLFIVIIRYLVALDTILEIRPAHVDFLKKHYSDGTFIVSGPQIPRTGGVILAKAINRHALLSILKNDPFCVNNYAEYQIFEFTINMCCNELKDFFQKL
ncbi:MAG: YciI family protein [Candidatus Paracaedibacteraceae bacterium]|nr:YciI family protein [Candidatus Paracaedibacteraceae bacterium]